MKVKIFISILIFTTLLTSCDDLLDVDYKSGITSANMWEDESDAIAAVNGTYRQFRSTFGYNLAFWGEYRSGLWGPGSDGSESYRDEIYLNKIPSSNSISNWASLYTTINDCNLILKHTPGINFSNEDKKNQVLGNAYFVRAYCYYWIARIWGDAPLLLKGFESSNQDDINPYREPVEDIFVQVDLDIEAGLKVMPASVTERNKASQVALNMLKADLHLWMAKVRSGGKESLLKAQAAINAISSNSNYSMENNYALVFKNKLNKEIIFAWSFLRDEHVGGYPDVFLEAPQNVTSSLHEAPVKVGSVRQRCFYTQEYMDFMASDSRDTRTVVSYEMFYDTGKVRMQQWINKFAGTWEQNTRILDSDIIAYRYADYHLFRAEIENALDNKDVAIEELNKIAQRAYGVDNYYPTTLTKAQVDEKILDERMKEFAAEGKLWWDFIRFGVVFQKVPSLIGRDNEKNILLWPIANASINTNPNITPNEFDY